MGEKSSGAFWGPEWPGLCPLCGKQSPPDGRPHAYHFPQPAKAQRQGRPRSIRLRRLVGMLRGGRSQTPTYP
jgi:hypothetical protein